jgi:REP element-mobilizing transposase RayT
MPKPRTRLVSLDDTPYYHCISRCVRRAFLCGVDARTGYDFSHRRAWIVERLQELIEVFTVELYAYAVMSNHYHVVVRVDSEKAMQLSDEAVAARWLSLFKGPAIVRDWRAGKTMGEGERVIIADLCATWRERLCDLSWFMRCLNEAIARMANREDRCTGRFWEGRFRSQALLGERALLACMAYVDLNPIRAGMVRTPEASDFTSVQARIQNARPRGLSLFADQIEAKTAIPFSYPEYLSLVDWTGRAMRTSKAGHIPADCPPILERLRMDPAELVHYARRKPNRLRHALGSPDDLRRLAQRMGLKFIAGIGLGRRLCPEPG